MHKVTISPEIEPECSGCHFLTIKGHRRIVDQCGRAVPDISYEVKCDRSSTAPCFKDKK